MPLSVTSVVGDPALSLVGGGTAGSAAHVLIFSGVASVDRLDKKLFEGNVGARLGFYVPQAGPFRPSHLLQAWAEVWPSLQHVTGGQHTAAGPYGVSDVAVELVNDARGSGMSWPYVWMTVRVGVPMQVRYRVTVTQPIENA